MSRWKDLERTAAKKLGGWRFPRWLDFRQSAPDVIVEDCKGKTRWDKPGA